MIDVRNLYLAYGKTAVIKGIDLSIVSPGITAILGPNGSGKSTLIKSILGIVVPQSGDILIKGDSLLNQWKYKEFIDYLPQIARFPENLKFGELLKIMKEFRSGKSREEELIEMFAMETSLQKKMGSLSGGMSQKANIILSLMFDNPILILDEPSSGLDPLSLLKFKSFIDREKKAGKTILLSTHILSIAEELSEYVIFILGGRIYFHGKLVDIKSKFNKGNLENTIAHILMETANVEGC